MEPDGCECTSYSAEFSVADRGHCIGLAVRHGCQEHILCLIDQRRVGHLQPDGQSDFSEASWVRRQLGIGIASQQKKQDPLRDCSLIKNHQASLAVNRIRSCLLIRKVRLLSVRQRKNLIFNVGLLWFLLKEEPISYWRWCNANKRISLRKMYAIVTKRVHCERVSVLVQTRLAL